MSSVNGSEPGAEAITTLRTKPRNTLLFRGLGPLVAAVVLFVAMLLIAPSVAPEHIVPVPVGVTTTTVATTVAN